MDPQSNPYQSQPPQYQPPAPPTVPLIEEHETDGLPATPVTSASMDWTTSATASATVETPAPSYVQPNYPSYEAPSVADVPSVSNVPQAPAANSNDPLRPLPVVRVLSPVGVEYVFLTFTLFSGAVGLASALIAMVNGKFDFTVLAFPAATLLVSVPVFAFLFLRLKKLELMDPSLKLDPSKRRSTQFTQIVSFVVSLFTLIGLVFAIFANFGGQSSIGIGKAILDALCVLVVASGILAYYWHDEHKGR